MPKTQPRDLYVPVQGLGDFVAVLKELFRTLYQSAHDHPIQSTAPAATDGSAGAIVIVDTGTAQSLYVKTASGWKSVALS